MLKIPPSLCRPACLGRSMCVVLKIAKQRRLGVDIEVVRCYRRFTLPETNIAPENRPQEKEIPMANHHF